ncbi:endochitinase-like [Ochlerotatus camptorhynchus]|uniref:endochitinase-like n=1 Tax=Ochlerotatus camptorhynchus TaxID=644619 RepID=UPI0031DDDDC7
MAQEPKLFLTVKSASLPTLNLPDAESAYLIVSDLMISPEGQPLPFLSGEFRKVDQSYFKRLHRDRPGVQFLASFGGTAVPPELFSHLSEDDGRLLRFVQQLVQFAKETGFNGLDISWMYPTQADNVSYSLLVRQLRAACDQENLILTVTVPSNPAVIGKNYPVEEIAKSAHYVILSTNEFRKLKKTSLIAPLYAINAGSSNSVDFHVNAWKMAGLASEKIVIIIQTTSLTYKLFQQKEYQLGTPVVRLKIRPFFKICHKLYSGSLEIFENNARCPYAFRELSWYSYENKQSIKEKVGYVLNQYLGGIAVAYYDEDDPTNLCGDGQYPLTAVVLASLKGLELPIDQRPSAIAQRSIHNGDVDSYEDVVDLHMVDAGSAHSTLADTQVPDPDEPSDEELPPEGDDSYNSKSSFVLRQIPTLSEPLCSRCSPPATTAASGYTEMRKDSSGSKLLYSKDRSYGCDNCTPSIFLVDSDHALAKLTNPSEHADERLLFSESSSSYAGSCNPLFTEPKPPVVVKPPPPEAQYDPARSRLGIIATCSTGNRPCNPNCNSNCNSNCPSNCNSNCRPCNGLPGRCGCFPCGGHIPQHDYMNMMPSGMAQTTPCPQAAFMEMFANMQNLARVNRHLESQSVDNQLGYQMCPYDGIIPDPRDPRHYFLCRQGLPMSDENRFCCANGYMYDPDNQKCVPEKQN